jgi:hypothetical protein
VCWGTPPLDWVACGFGAAPDDVKCAKAVTHQLVSVGKAVAFLSSFGASSAVKGDSDFANLMASVKDVAERLKEFLDNSQVVQAGKLVDAISDLEKIDPETTPPEDIVRAIAKVTELFDPTGISSILSAYTFQLCSEIL